MIGKNLRCMAALLLATNLICVTPNTVWADGENDHDGQGQGGNGQGGPSTTTPIKHVVIIFQENVSFDHYFATYPVATNPAGEVPKFAQARHPDSQWAHFGG